VGKKKWDYTLPNFSGIETNFYKRQTLFWGPISVTSGSQEKGQNPSDSTGRKLIDDLFMLFGDDLMFYFLLLVVMFLVANLVVFI